MRLPPARRVSGRERFVAAGLGAAILALLCVSASLTPDPQLHGTHTRLGLPACAWAITLGKPCPTCGMTTAFAATATLRWITAWRAQPFGMGLCLVSAAAMWGCLHAAVFGVRAGALGGTLLRGRVMWPVAAAWAASWAYRWLTWAP